MSMALHAVHGLPLCVEGDEMTGNIFAARLAGHKIRQQALAAGVRPRWIIEVQAGGGVLENGGCLPGSPHTAAIATLLEEVEFKLENVENFGFDIRHETPPGG